MAAAKLEKIEKMEEVLSKAPSKETIYTVEELIDCQQLFGSKIRKECIIAAFRMKGIKGASVSDAKKIVNEFLRKEVS